MNLNKYSKETLIRFIESQPRLGDITPLLDMFEEAVQMERLIGQAKSISNEVETLNGKPRTRKNLDRWVKLNKRIENVTRRIEDLLVTAPEDLTKKK